MSEITKKRCDFKDCKAEGFANTMIHVPIATGSGMGGSGERELYFTYIDFCPKHAAYVLRKVIYDMVSPENTKTIIKLYAPQAV